MSAHFIPLSQILNVVTAATLLAESVGHQPALLPVIRLKSAANSASLTVRLPFPPPPPPPPPWILPLLLLPPHAIKPASTSKGRTLRRNLRNVCELETGEGLLDIVFLSLIWIIPLPEANMNPNPGSS